MRFKISIYGTKKYKTSKNKVLEFSEFKDIVNVDKNMFLYCIISGKN